MKNILVYTENYQRGGGNQYLVDIINNIPNEYSIDIVSNTGGIFKEDFLKLTVKYHYDQISIYSLHKSYNYFNSFFSNRYFIFLIRVLLFLFKLPLSMMFRMLNSNTISKQLNKKKYDLIIVCNGGFPGGISCLDCVDVANKLNIDIWLSVVSMPQKKTVVDLIYSKTLKKIEKLIVNSHFISKAFVESRGVEISKIKVMHNCLPNESIDKVPVLQKQYDTKVEKYVLGYVGRIEKAKGIFYLLEAFVALSKKFPNLKLKLVGTGDDINEAIEYCRIKGIAGNVEFTGFYSGKINEVMKSFDLFVFPSLWEGLPYSILEAMANSKLVVSTNVGGIPEIITDGVNGFLVEPANSKAFFEKLEFVLDEFTDYSTAVNKSLRTIQAEFSEDNFRNNLHMLFINKS
jgi:glycosyltransferase involved in cell wall biosynthesis